MLLTPPSRPITHCVHMRTQLLPHPYAVRTPHSRSTSSLPQPPPTRPRQSLQGLPMTIHSSRVGCRYVLYSRSVRFAWAPSSARKVKMRIRTQLRAFLHAARVVGTVLAVRNHAAYAPVRTLRARVRSVLTPPFSRCVHAYAACRPTARPSRTEPAHQTRWSDRSRADASALRSAGRLVHAKYVVHSC